VTQSQGPVEKQHGLKRVVRAFYNSLNGLAVTARNEAAFRQELILGLVLLPVVFLVDVTRIDRILMLSSMLLVLVAEVVNSAIESTVDRIGLERHELSGRAKDQASAGVLLSMLIFLVVWAGALWPVFADS